MITKEQLVEYAKGQLGRPYWYGTYGQITSAALLGTKRQQYPKYYNQDNYKVKFTDQYGQKAHDCAGLIKGAVWCDGVVDAKPTYVSKQDLCANDILKKACSVTGDIKDMPDVPGILVHYSGHIGIYIGGGYVIEARGHDYGVVKTKLGSRAWEHYGFCDWIQYGDLKKKTVNVTVIVDGVTYNGNISEV